MSLLDRTNSISKKGPQSLLPEEEPRGGDMFGRRNEPLPKVGPQDLLPEAGRVNDDDGVAESLPSISPSSLLDEPARPRIPRRRVLVACAALVLVLGVVGLVFVYRADTRTSEQILQEALISQAAGQHETALIHLKALLAREPLNGQAHLFSGTSYLATGAMLDAEKAFGRARELHVPLKDLATQLAEALIALDRHEEALKLLGEALLDTSSPEIALLKGQAYLGLGNFVEARTQYAIAQTKRPVESTLGLARIMLMEGNPDGAAALIGEATAAYPAIADVWVAKGDLLRSIGKSDDSLNAYRKAQSIRHNHLEAALGAAIVLTAKGELGEANRELRKARAISPSNHLVGYASAMLAFREHRFDATQDMLRAVLQTAPQHMPSVLLAGSLALATGDLEQANNAFVSYLARFPGQLQARKLHAITLLRLSQPEAAVETVAPFVKYDIPDAEFYAVAGQAYMQVGQIRQARDLLEKAARLKPDNADALTNLGVVYLNSGVVEKGIAELKKAVSLGPKGTQADRHLVFALASAKRYDEALQAVEGLERRHPELPDGPWLRGVVHAARDDQEAAAKYFEVALKRDLGFYPAAAAMARIDAARGKSADAAKRFQGVLSRNPKHLDAGLALAELEAAGGSLDQAVARVERIINEHPRSSEANVAMARLRLRQEKAEEALNAARRAREINPRDPVAVETLGRIQQATGDRAGATLSFTTLVNMRPRYLPGLLLLANAQRTDGELRSAVETARRALGVSSTNPDVMSLLGDLLLESKRYDEALQFAAKVRQSLPRRGLGDALEGRVHLARNELKLAAAAFRRSDALERNGPVRVFMHQAETLASGREATVAPLLEWLELSPDDVGVRLYCADSLARSGRLDEAMKHYEIVLKQMPEDFRVLNNIADALARKGDPRALDFAQRAFQLRPHDPIVSATLGTVLLQRDKLYEAIQAFQRALQTAPDNPEIRYQFVQALLRAGDRARARSELKALLATGKDFSQADEARRLAATLQ